MTREDLLNNLAKSAGEAGVFAAVRVEDGRLVCDADGAAEPAFYRVFFEGDTAWVSLVTKDRWLSESVEADLMHSGDKLEELIEEEMVDLGYDGPPPTYEHFRSEDLEFTFRTPVRGSASEIDGDFADRARQTLLGYEACFRQLGDMEESED